jgi:hypothetical protein
MFARRTTTSKSVPSSGNRLLAVACGALLWACAPAAFAVPVLYVAVNAGPTVSFETETVCSGAAPVTCVGAGSEGDLVISSFELTADPGAYLAGSFNFYNASTTDTLSVLATVLFPLSGSFATPTVAGGTGLVNNVFGGGILNIEYNGYADFPSSALISITQLAGPAPFSVCDDPGADPGCQASVFSLSDSYGSPTLNVLSNIGFTLAFDLSPDTTATIGFDGGEALNGGTSLSFTPVSVVPVPAAAWLFLSALGATLTMRRNTTRGTSS